MLAGLLVLAGMTGPIQAPVAPMRYKVEYDRKQEFDLSAMGAPNQVATLNGTAFITVTMMDTAGGQLAHIVVDSLVLNATGPMAGQITQATVDSAKGGFLHAYIVNGKPKGTPVPSLSDNTALRLLGSVVGMLFPGARAGAKVGDMWSDTTKVDTTTAQGHQAGVTSVDWSVSGTEGAALLLEGKASAHMNIDQDNGQSIEITSTGTHKAAAPANGPSLHVTSETSSDLLVNVPGAPVPISGTDVVKVTVTPIT